MASVRVRNLQKHFGSVKAVDNMDLEIEDGEFVAFLGPSGCGKTTTLRMISGLEIPTGGTIHIGERDVTNLPPRSRDVAMVFQDYALYPHMTIHDNIGYPLKVRGTNPDEVSRRVRDVAQNLQITPLLQRRPGQLSGGQQQRTALARAVVHSAQVFLFDEPLSNLDAKLRLEARAFIKHLQREVGVTAIYVTHDQSEAMGLADRIVVMNAGKIMQVGNPLEIYRRPANTFVASFIGNPPMNLLPCTIDIAARTLTIDGQFTLRPEPFNAPAGVSAGQPLLLGIRPEHIAIGTEPDDNALPAEIYVVQTLGGEVLISARVGEHLVAVRVFEDEPPQLPTQVWLKPDFTRAYFYSTEGDGELLR
jgi:multiple sugar transport system ATP-binding protein